MDLINFSGYKVAASFCRINQAGGGVCILLNDNIDFRERSEFSSFSVQYCIEVCATELVKENTILIALYWNGKKQKTFFKQLELILNYIDLKYSKSNIIFGGDFNINILKNSKKTNQLLELMLEHQLSQYIKQHTHILPHSSTCIDLIFTNMDKNLFNTSVEEFGFSHHLGTVLHLNTSQLKDTSTWYVTKRLYNTINIEKFKTDLQNIQWGTIILPTNSLNENYSNFNETLMEVLNKNIPKRKIKVKTRGKKYWLTTGIKKSCYHKRMLKIISQKTKDKVLRNHYKLYAGILKKAIYTSKKQFYINRMKNSKNKMKTAWNIINERTNKKKGKAHKNITLVINNSSTSKPDIVANSFNNYFASIGLERIKTNATAQSLPVTPCTENTMFLSPGYVPKAESSFRYLSVTRLSMMCRFCCLPLAKRSSRAPASIKYSMTAKTVFEEKGLLY
ncbi:endonuclease-reverse transcriptase domain-containing protein [Phthorimaea operculella]|nr:endonuclease-reverse transcriptase domain-containing protein [Phthorimaea operculella]